MKFSVNSQRIRLLLLWLAFSILVVAQLSLILRNPVLNLVLDSATNRYNLTWKGRLEIGQARIRGFSSILLTGIRVIPPTGDTLLKIDSADVAFNPLKLLMGRLSIVGVKLTRTRVNLICNDTLSNYWFLFEGTPGKPATDTLASVTQTPVDYATAVDQLTRLAFDLLPSVMKATDLQISSLNNDHLTTFSIPELNLKDHLFTGAIYIAEADSTGIWRIDGRMDNHHRSLRITLFPEGAPALKIPFVKYRWGAEVEFTVVAFSLTEKRLNDSTTALTGSAYFRGLAISHPRLAAEKVIFDSLGADYTLLFGLSCVAVDSSTRIRFNRLDFHPSLIYRSHPSHQISIRIVKEPFPANDLFESLPSGLFTTLHGVEVQGELSWYLDFYVDLSIPDSLRFTTELKRHHFTLVSQGSSDLTRMNHSFEYTAYEKGIPVKSFIVGPENPDFRPLDKISPYLIHAVMTSEDGGFFLHRGFLPEAFRESIITNIKERRFARGGSTISMQLVKNVFLSRNKTIARKLEEALIVWLIENQGLCTKERMLEVYLNIIEWGPMIYGAGEASRFYFDKDPSRLTLAEAIFMASIIPRPKWFRYNFDDQGRLRASMADYYHLVGTKMLAKGWITPQDFDRLLPEVTLKGAAKSMLVKRDTVQPDSLLYGEE